MATTCDACGKRVSGPHEVAHVILPMPALPLAAVGLTEEFDVLSASRERSLDVCAECIAPIANAAKAQRTEAS
jgi:hypothetical protein